MKPLLELVMIVKDEAASIADTIDSVRGFVDRWTILDTGSTDGTQDIIRECFRGVPGQLVEEPFVDFATTRNRALDLADSCTFALMLSGDETVTWEMRELYGFCQEHQADSTGAYLVDVQMAHDTYGSARLTRTASRWRYVGATHEVLVSPDGNGTAARAPGLIVHHVGRRTREGMIGKWERDLQLLDRALKTNPEDTRAAFYRAQSLDMLHRTAEAISAYEHRVYMARYGGFREEVFISLLRIARGMRTLGEPWPDVEHAFLRAWAHSPQRAEPILDIADHLCRKAEDHQRAYYFATAAAAIPYPKDDVLFIERDCYHWMVDNVLAISGSWIGKLKEGEAAIRRALAVRPDDVGLQNILKHYEGRER